MIWFCKNGHITQQTHAQLSQAVHHEVPLGFDKEAFRAFQHDIGEAVKFQPTGPICFTIVGSVTNAWSTNSRKRLSPWNESCYIDVEVRAPELAKQYRHRLQINHDYPGIFMSNGTKGFYQVVPLGRLLNRLAREWQEGGSAHIAFKLNTTETMETPKVFIIDCDVKHNVVSEYGSRSSVDESDIDLTPCAMKGCRRTWRTGQCM